MHAFGMRQLASRTIWLFALLPLIACEPAPKPEPATVAQAVATPPSSEPPTPASDPTPEKLPLPTPPEETDHATPSFTFPRPEQIRGLYVNAWSAGSRRRMTALLDLATRTEINSFVIDIKDASGYVSHPTAVPLARAVSATEDVRIPDLAHLLVRIEEAGIFPIARIVIVKDPLVATARPELAVQDTAGGVWLDGNGVAWLNPYDRRVWDYHIALAREAAEAGFLEIQWDYVRFPDAPASELGRAHFPGGEGSTKPQAIRAFLAESRSALADLDVTVTADVFGITTSATRGVGIGQLWESFIDVVDVALPMIYPSHYSEGSFGFNAPNAHPYEVVRRALEDGLRRSDLVEGAGAIRPWLQDFSLGDPPYGAPEVRAQIQAGYDVGVYEWILWNPASRYTEEALLPADSQDANPLMRIAEVIVPASERFEHFDTVTAVVAEEADLAPASDVQDTLLVLPDTAGVVPDTSGARPI